MAIVIILVITALAVRGITKPFIGLLALMVVYIIQPGELYPILAPLHLERTLAVFVIASFFFHGEKLRFPPVTKWFLAFYGSMIIAIPLAFWVANSAMYCLQFGEIVVLHLLIVGMVTTEERFRQLLLTFVALIGWLGGTSMLLYLEGVRIFTMGIERAAGLTSSGGDPNTLGVTLVSAMPLELLVFTASKSKWQKLLALAVFAVSVWTLISTGSRTSFFAFGLFILLSFFAEWRKRLKFLPLLLVLAPIGWLLIPQQYKARYETVDNLQNDDSYQNRVLSWEGGVQMFLHNPLTGVGPDNYASANGERYWPGKPRHYLDAHSLFFKVLGELAVVGICTFFMYLFTLFRENARLLRNRVERSADGIIQKFPLYCNLSLMILLFAGYSGHNLYRNTWYILGAFTASLGLLQPTLERANVEEEVTVPRGAAWIPNAEKPEAVGAVPWS